MKISSQSVGAYGEKIVEAELLRRGWAPANVNASIKNAANYDIFAQKDGRPLMLIRVKTCGPGWEAFQFSFAVGKEITTEHLLDDDFTVLVNMREMRMEGDCKDEPRDECWVIPTAELWHDIQQYRSAYLKQPTKGGAPRKDTGHWTLHLKSMRSGEDRLPYGFRKEWNARGYLGNWDFKRSTMPKVSQFPIVIGTPTQKEGVPVVPAAAADGGVTA